MVYLLHFDRPFGHARHYLGYCADGALQPRLTRHLNGSGSKLMGYVAQAGIGFTVARTWSGGRGRERQLKIQGGASRLCPICKGGWTRPNQCKG